MKRGILGMGIVSGLLFGACAVAAALGACSSSSTTSTGGNTSDAGAVACTDTKSLQVLFAPMYSAFVTDSNMHVFQVPAITQGVMGTATWSASDSSAVSFTPDPTTGGTMITVLKAGPPVTITAQIGAACGTSVLTVSPATEADWQNGNARYNNGVPVYPGCVGAKVAPLLVDSGYKLPPPPEAGCPDAGPACTGCHGDNPTGGFFSGVQHTPEQTGGFSDQALVGIFHDGTDPTYDTSYLPYEYWHAFHTWTDIATPEQQKGIITYLRALKPVEDMGGVNFGQLQDSGIAQ
jgi:hypothetical protein